VRARARQVVYPALDAKVKNVTLAYSVEHEDEVRRRRAALLPRTHDRARRGTSFGACALRAEPTRGRGFLGRSRLCGSVSANSCHGARWLLPGCWGACARAARRPRARPDARAAAAAQERLFEQLMQLLAAALAGPAAGRGAAVRRLSCKAEEIHTTLRKHLAKEEEQLFPLLLAHFSAAEQAELVAQFLCCIPLAAVQPVLAWLQPAVPVAEQEALLAQARARLPLFP
jgi:hypothetical protein